jgi:hypothetical protein
VSATIGDNAVKQQAIRLATSALRKRRVPAATSPEKVAPIVYALLVDEVDPLVIEKALIEADVLTGPGITYTLSRLTKPPEGQRFPMNPVQPQPYTPPSDAERQRAREAIKNARLALRGGSAGA